jgi:hypothetical protein
MVLVTIGPDPHLVGKRALRRFPVTIFTRYGTGTVAALKIQTSFATNPVGVQIFP